MEVVTGWAPPEAVSELTRLARSLYAEIERRGAAVIYASQAKLRVSARDWGGLCLGNAFDFLNDVGDRAEAESLLRTAASLVASDSYRRGASDQSRVNLLTNHCFFRRMTERQAVAVAWHCDAEAASTMLLPGFEEMRTAWMPLTLVGGVAGPTLEIARDSNRVMIGETLEACAHRPTAWVEALGCAVVAPALVPGDAILFDQFTLHRTEPAPVRGERLTCELRFVPG